MTWSPSFCFIKHKSKRLALLKGLVTQRSHEKIKEIHGFDCYKTSSGIKEEENTLLYTHPIATMPDVDSWLHQKYPKGFPLDGSVPMVGFLIF